MKRLLLPHFPELRHRNLHFPLAVTARGRYGRHLVAIWLLFSLLCCTCAHAQLMSQPVYGLDFSPYVGSGQDPNYGSTVSAAQVTALLEPLQGKTQWIRTFGTQNGLQYVAQIAHQMGFKTAIGAYIGSDSSVNNAQVAELIREANAGFVDLAIVGNESLLQNTQSAAQIVALIQYVKSQIPAGIPVTYVDTWNTIVANPSIIAAEDVVCVNIYPFYEDKAFSQALGDLQTDYAQTVQDVNQIDSGKQVIISETGWPSSGSPPSTGSAAVPGLTSESTYFSEVEDWAQTSSIPLFFMEAYDEPWKANHNDYPSWGVWDSSVNEKSGMSPVFENVPGATWRVQQVAVAPNTGYYVLWTMQSAGGSSVVVWTLDGDGNVVSTGGLYGPYPGWVPRQLVVAPDSTARLLWTNTQSGSDAFVIWTLNAGGFVTAGGSEYGPYTGFIVPKIAVDSGGSTRVAFVSAGTNTNYQYAGDQVVIWTLNSSGARTSTGALFGPYRGWGFSDLVAGLNGSCHLLWCSNATQGPGAAPANAFVDWILDSNGLMAYGGSSYGPYQAAQSVYWLVQGFDVNRSDGTARVLWAAPDSSGNLSLSTLWVLNATGRVTAGGPEFGPQTGWSARDLFAAGNGTARIVWTPGTGNTIPANQAFTVWTLGASGNLENQGPVYGPYTNWPSFLLDLDRTYNSTRVLWQYDNPNNTLDPQNNAFTLWQLDGAGRLATSGPEYTP